MRPGRKAVGGRRKGPGPVPAAVAVLVLALILVLGAGLLSGCGKKGALSPAWTVARVFPPMRVTDLIAEVRGGRVWLSWTEPDKNTDGSAPVTLDRYVIDYNVLPVEEKYCLTCPLQFAQSLDLDPSNPKEAVFQAGRVEIPVEDFSPASKYLFQVWAMTPEDESAGASNLATLNWPLKAKES